MPDDLLGQLAKLATSERSKKDTVDGDTSIAEDLADRVVRLAVSADNKLVFGVVLSKPSQPFERTPVPVADVIESDDQWRERVVTRHDLPYCGSRIPKRALKTPSVEAMRHCHVHGQPFAGALHMLGEQPE